jgi:hypothetical protein
MRACRKSTRRLTNVLSFWCVAESLAQELEMERKNRQQQNAAQQQDRDVKSPLQGRHPLLRLYYKGRGREKDTKR